ncbi:MAG: hypothetical protein WC833_01320 [Bacteroidales bacterium]|jgi:hypothetical protein
MKTGRIILVSLTLATLFLTGCIKEALLLDKLRGEWEIDKGECLVTTNADVTFLDFYSKPWTGTVTVNGVEQDCSNSRLTTLWSTYFFINPNIYLFIFQSPAKIAYKTKKYDSPINWETIKTGIINTELTLTTTDNNIVNIKIDLKAPMTTLKKGVEYPISDIRWSQDQAVNDLKFLSPTRISGSIALGDIMSSFTGTWSASSSKITLKMKPYYSYDKTIQTHNYFYNSQELTLFKNIDYYKTEREGAIPLDKIATVKQVIHYKRKN